MADERAKILYRSYRRICCFSALLILTAVLILIPTSHLGQPDGIQVDAVVSAASFSRGRAVAPGSLVTIFGRGLASGVFMATATPLPNVLGSTSVMVNGVRAPLFYASATQINLQFPYELQGQTASLVVQAGGSSSNVVTVPLVSAAPSVFSLLANGAGPGAIVHLDGSPVSLTSQLQTAEIVSIYATGLGPVIPPVAAGAAAPLSPLSLVTSPVRVLFDGVPGGVEFAGLAPKYAGLYQINVRVPSNLPSRYPTVTLDMGGTLSESVTAGGPGVLDVTPATVPLGGGATLLLRGANFSASSVVEIAGQRIQGQWLPGNPEQFVVTIPAGLLTVPGRISLALRNPDGNSELRSNAVELLVAAPSPPLVSKSDISFARNAACGAAPSSDVVSITSSASTPLDWSATTSGESWLAISPQRGTTPASLTVTVSPAGLPPGQYAGAVTVTAASDPAADVKIKVTLTVNTGTPAVPVTSPNVYTLDSLRRVKRNDLPLSNGATSAQVFAARNEYQAFQIVINGGTTGFTGVNVSTTSALVGPQCSTLPAAGLTFYREHYVNVTQPSNAGAGGAQAGVYPDALIPFKNPFTGQPLSGGTYPSAPFEVPPGQNQPVYVEIYVPDGTPAGVYAGAVTVTRDNSIKVADVPVSLTVLNIAIPKTPSLRSSFHDYDSDHSLGPARYYGYANQSPEHFSLAKALDENLIAHRVMPEGPIGTAFNADSRGHIVPNSQVDATITSLLTRPEYTDFVLSFGEGYPFDKPTTQNRSLALIFLSDAFQWFSSRGLVDKVWLRPQDEPQTKADFQRVRDFADLIHDANPKYRVAITADFSQPEVQTYLYGHINMFIMGSWSWDPVATALRLAAGDRIWSYTGDVENYRNPSPFWQIDFPLLNYRIVPWISYRYGLEGMLYWTSHYWEQVQARGHSPWTDPCTDIEGGSCYNGEGMLVYPGKEVNYVIPQNAYRSASPVPVYGPIPSLRLKAIRDGMQDYELLVLAAGRDSSFATQAAIQVGCAGNPNPGDANTNCFHSWSTNPDTLLQMRIQLAQRAASR